MTIGSVYLDMKTLPPGLVVLTPNRRMAAWLVRDHDQQQQATGAKSWARLNVQPLDSWLQQLFDEICLLLPAGERGHPRLLSKAQSALFWRQILEQEELVDLDGMVALAGQAHPLTLRWCWNESHWQMGRQAEQQAFEVWHESYCELLEKHHCIDQAMLARWIMQQGGALRPGLPRTFWLHGFNDPDEPQLKQLVAWLEADGIRVQLSSIPPRSSRASIQTFPQVSDQFASAIQWALQQRKLSGRTGIVIPGLQSLRGRIRALCQHAWSLQDEAGQFHWSEIFNITAGRALDDYPLVAHVLSWLRALVAELPWQEWNVLLTSPFCCQTETEWLQRDEFCTWLRKENQRALRLGKLRTLWKDHCGTDETALWLEQVQMAQARKHQPVSGWIAWFRQFLNLIFSRQGRTLDSEEFQVQQRLLDVAAQLQELGEWLGDIDFRKFHAELESALHDAQFQPQTETAPIQIMGTLEAAGLGFDHLWVCELEAANWPQPLNPNPLLSRRVQRYLNMPGASPERELRYASRLLQQFKTAADEVVFSWGEWQGEAEHTRSALLDDVQTADWQPARLASPETMQFEKFRTHIDILPADVQGTPVQTSAVKGGSGIIKSQSLCAFKAFAEYRLNIRSPWELEDGIRLSDRGTFLHDVMEAIWRELKDSAALQKLLDKDEELDVLLDKVVDEALKKFRARVHLKPDALYQLERERVFRIARKWLLEVDGARNPFSVAQVEKKRSLQLAGLTLDLTVDRIDELADEQLVIIDYKTSSKDHKLWEGERPEEPQLPLYSLLEKDKTQGLLFGVLSSSDPGYKGLMNDPVSLLENGKNGLKKADDWNEIMNAWEQVLSRLADEFRQGRAEVAPLNDKVCTYCHLAPVCRINEVGHDSE